MSQECATTGCYNAAAWIPISEGNKYGNEAPRRCVECCDTIADLDIPPLALVNVQQIKPWDSAQPEYRSESDEMGRMVLVLDETTHRGTVLARWYGPR